MQLIGKVLHISRENLIVLCSTKEIVTPKSGRRVTTYGKKPIGRVSEVFGPLSRPYISVKPFKGVETKKIIGELLYIT